MIVRSLQQLKRAQRELLAEHKRGRHEPPAPEETIANGGRVRALLGRILKTVESDPVLGPHLLVVLQGFVGSPPEPAGINDDRRVCYPAPGRKVAEYELDSYVQVLPVGEAWIAVRL